MKCKARGAISQVRSRTSRPGGVRGHGRAPPWAKGPRRGIARELPCDILSHVQDAARMNPHGTAAAPIMPGSKREFLTELFQRYAIELRAFARQRVHEDEADDLVQEAYLRLVQQTTPEDLAYPRAFLWRTAANLAVDRQRRNAVRSRGRDPAVDLDALSSPAASLEAGADAARQLDRVRAVLAALPPIHRDALVLGRVAGLGLDQVARRLGVSKKTAERSVSKALEALRDALDRE